MGIAQRDYMREPAGPGVFRSWGAVHVIIAINIAVFLGWFFAVSNGDTRFMSDHFATSEIHLSNGAVWTLVTSVFSHLNVWHLALNMFVLYSFGVTLERMWGTRKFVIFYLVAGIVSGLAHCGVEALMERHASALGASGAISGLLAAFVFLFPRATVLLMGIIPMPAFLVLVLLVGWDVYGLFLQTQSRGFNIGHAAHLGGAVCGVVFYFWMLRNPRPRPVRIDTGDDSFDGISPEDRQQMDHILGKVNELGVEGLTQHEREFLVRMSERMQKARGRSRQ